MSLQRLFGDRHHRRVHAHRRNMRQSRHRVVQVNRFLAQLPDLARRILALERRQVDHAENQLERLDFRGRLDGTAGEARDALVDADLVDGRDPAEIRETPALLDDLERRFERIRVGRVDADSPATGSASRACGLPR